MVFEAHGMSLPCIELLLFNYTKVNTVFHSMAPLNSNFCMNTQDIFSKWDSFYHENKSYPGPSDHQQANR